MRRGLLDNHAKLVDDAWTCSTQQNRPHPEPAELWWTVVGRQRSGISC